MAEGFVQVPPDSSGKSIDTSELTRPSGTVVERQRLSLGSSDGTLLEATNGAFPVYSTELATLLRAIIIRLDILNALVDPREYAPPDDLSDY